MQAHGVFGPTSRLRSSSKGKTKTEELDVAMKQPMARLEAEGFTPGDIKAFITCVEKGMNIDDFLSIFKSSSPLDNVVKARLGLAIYKQLQEACRGKFVFFQSFSCSQHTIFSRFTTHNHLLKYKGIKKYKYKYKGKYTPCFVSGSLKWFFSSHTNAIFLSMMRSSCNSDTCGSNSVSSTCKFGSDKCCVALNFMGGRFICWEE